MKTILTILLLILSLPVIGFEINFDVGIDLYKDTLPVGDHYEMYVYKYPFDIEISDNTMTTIQTLKVISMDPLPPGSILMIKVRTSEIISKSTITHVKGVYNEETSILSNPLGSLSAPLSISRSDSDMGIWRLDYKGSLY